MSEENIGGEVSAETTGSTPEATEASQEVVNEASEGSDVVEGAEGYEEGQEVSESESEPEVYTITVDGEKLEVTLDELLKSAQTARASGKRFQEAASLRKEAERAREEAKMLEEALLRNPLEAMRKKGIPDEHIFKHYEDVLYQKYQFDALSDEEKAARRKEAERERQLQEYQEQLKELEALKKEKEEQAFREQVAAQEAELTEQFMAALDSQQIPQSPEAIQWMANYMAASIEAGEEVDLPTAAAYYKKNTSTSLKDQLAGLSEDQILELIGEKKLNKLRSKEIQKVKNGKAKRSVSKDSLAEKIVKRDGGDVTNMSDFFDSLKREAYKY